MILKLNTNYRKNKNYLKEYPKEKLKQQLKQILSKVRYWRKKNKEYYYKW